jgi:hypothetical protein
MFTEYSITHTIQVYNSDLFIAPMMKSHFELSQTGNMDPVPLTLKVPQNKTVDIKSITIKISGHKKTHHNAVLACCTDGTELSPL